MSVRLTSLRGRQWTVEGGISSSWPLLPSFKLCWYIILRVVCMIHPPTPLPPACLPAPTHTPHPYYHHTPLPTTHPSTWSCRLSLPAATLLPSPWLCKHACTSACHACCPRLLCLLPWLPSQLLPHLLLPACLPCVNVHACLPSLCLSYVPLPALPLAFFLSPALQTSPFLY